MAKIRELKPIKESKTGYEKIEVQIKSAFKDVVYEPVMRELNVSGPEPKSLFAAIQSGRVTFSKGRFRGRFNATVTRELKELGATWDPKTSSFRMLQRDLPPAVRAEIDVSSARFTERLAKIDKTLSQILPEVIAGKVQASAIFDASLWKVEREFRNTLKNITIPPELSPERRKRIAAEWQTNLDLWIKDFAAEEIPKLRKYVQQCAFAGNRYESMISTIQKSYGVTANKAKFLAKQETSLLMAKYKETRYAEAGVMEYRWRCVAGSPKHPVRPAHKALDGKIFRWDDPPVTTSAHEPIRRNNPGQDFNCRCAAIPVVRFKTESAA